jgi:hypothetical protein
MADTKDLSIVQGKTFSLVLRWETEPIQYKKITSILQEAPVRITVTAHGIPNGWRCAVTNVKGMTEINSEANNLKDKDFNPVTVVDPNTIEINAINAAGFRPYVSGGIIQFNTPVNMTGYSARMSIKDKVGGTLLKSLTTVGGGITLDIAACTITLNISAADTTLFDWKKAVYELEMVSPSDIVTALLVGAVTVTKEVTT